MDDVGAFSYIEHTRQGTLHGPFTLWDPCSAVPSPEDPSGASRWLWRFLVRWQR